MELLIKSYPILALSASSVEIIYNCHISFLLFDTLIKSFILLFLSMQSISYPCTG